MIPRNIQLLIDADDVAGAIDALTRFVADCSGDDELYYVLGRLHWRQGNHSEAENCYRRAIALNPDSKARYALEIAVDVFDYCNQDLLNP